MFPNRDHDVDQVSYVDQAPDLNQGPDLMLLPWLFLLTDSALPIGAFSHSFGLETLIAGGVRDIQKVREILTTYLEEGLGRCDCPAAALAYRAAAAGDLDELLGLDELVNALRLPREWREAGAQMGRRLLFLATDLWGGTPSPVLTAFSEAVALGQATGQHPVAAGVVFHATGLPLDWVLCSFLYSALQGLVLAAVRLVPLGQTEGQRLLLSLHPRISLLMQKALAVKNAGDLCSFQPGLEIAGMQHECLYTRLFIS